MNLAEEIKSKVTIMDLARAVGCDVTDKSVYIRSFDHEDSNPSLRLYPRTNTWFDWSRNIGGDIFKFVMVKYNVDFKKSVEIIASLFGYSYSSMPGAAFDSQRESKPLPKEKAFDSGDFKSSLTEDELYYYDERFGVTGSQTIAFREVKKYRLERNKEVFLELYNYCVDKGWDESIIVYLLEDRKLSMDVIKKLKYFCIKNYYEVNQHMKKVFPIEQLVKSGLFNNRRDEYGRVKNNLIFNQHRIIIPHLWKGEIYYLRARYFDMNDNTKPQAPHTGKYSGLINDALDLNRARIFYNYDILRNMLPGEKVYINEGELDVASTLTIGFNAIGINGASNIPEMKWFNLLSDLDVIAAVDNDEAGRKLLTGHYTLNGVDKYTEKNLLAIFESMGKEIKVKEFQEKDINEFLKKHAG